MLLHGCPTLFHGFFVHLLLMLKMSNGVFQFGSLCRESGLFAGQTLFHALCDELKADGQPQPIAINFLEGGKTRNADLPGLALCSDVAQVVRQSVSLSLETEDLLLCLEHNCYQLTDRTYQKAEKKKGKG